MEDNGAASARLLVIEAPSEMVQRLVPLEMVRYVLAPSEVQKEPAQAGQQFWTVGQR